MKRARKYKSKIVERIISNQDPLIAARNKKKLILAAIIADALDRKEIQKSKLAELLGKYSSEVTRWTSGFHNFTSDTLSDIEEVLGVSLLNTEHPKQMQNLSIDYTLTVDLKSIASKSPSKEEIARATNYIFESGGVLPSAATTK